MKPTAPVETDIVLLGAGHAHVEVLRAFAMKPEPGVRLTLIGREPATPLFRHAARLHLRPLQL